MILYLDTFGAFLGVREGAFLVRWKDREEVVAVRRVTAIHVHAGAAMSTDALLLALDHEVPVVLSDRVGRPKGQLWNSRFGSVATIRKNQLAFSRHLAGVRWARDQVLQKIRNQHGFLLQVAYAQPNGPPPKLLEGAGILAAMAKQVGGTEPQVSPLTDTYAQYFASLRGWEGTASRHYFKGLSDVLPESARFEDRNRRPARDPFNAALNYLYGILYSRVEMSLIRAGLDPAIGIFHADEYNRPALVFDFIEPYRIWAETVAFRLFQRYALGEGSFQPREGGLWLQGDGKYAVIDAFEEYLKEPTLHNGKQRKRLTQLDLNAHAFAQELLRFKV